MQKIIKWFEIPCENLDRATAFYESIFDISLQKMILQNLSMSIFPTNEDQGVTGGAIVKANNDFYQSSPVKGPLLYLNGDPDVQLILDKVEIGGGQIVIPKTRVSDAVGYIAVITDSEGNRIGLMSKA